MDQKTCVVCGQPFTAKGTVNTCAPKCRAARKEAIMKVARHKWKTNNPKKAREASKKSSKKWNSNNPEKVREASKRIYKKKSRESRAKLRHAGRMTRHTVTSLEEAVQLVRAAYPDAVAQGSNSDWSFLVGGKAVAQMIEKLRARGRDWTLVIYAAEVTLPT